MIRGGSDTLSLLVMIRTIPLRVLMNYAILAGIGRPGGVAIYLAIDRGRGMIS